MKLSDLPQGRAFSHAELVAWMMAITPGIRLTLTQGTPVTVADVTGATTIYAEPFNGGIVPLFGDAAGKVPVIRRPAASAVSLALGTMALAGYDVFLYDSAGAVAMEKAEWANGVATMTIASPCVVTWTSNTLANGNPVSFTTTGTLPTGLAVDTVYYVVNNATDGAGKFRLAATLGGAEINSSGSQSGTHTIHGAHARQTAVDLVNGRYYKNGDYTRLLAGSFYPTSTTTTADSVAKRVLSNALCPINRRLFVAEATNTWTYASTTTRQANAAVGNQLEVMQSRPDNFLQIVLQALGAHSSTSNFSAGIGEDSTTVFSPNQVNYQGGGAASNLSPMAGVLGVYPSPGSHRYTWLEKGVATGTMTFYSLNSGTRQSGLTGSILA